LGHPQGIVGAAVQHGRIADVALVRHRSGGLAPKQGLQVGLLPDPGFKVKADLRSGD
jgi:hypothetical protein